MPETNPISNPSQMPLEDREMAGYGFYGKSHDSSRIKVGNFDIPIIYPGSGMAKEKNGIKKNIRTTGGI